MKTLIIYHSADFDGVMGGLIVRKYIQSFGKANPGLFISIESLGWNYGDSIPNVESLLSKYDQIYMTDLSFPVDEMKILSASGKFVWIDHHITALQDSVTYGYDNCTGLRRNGTAACELTWEYLFPNTPCPEIVQYLGAWDVFAKNRFDWEGVVNPIQVACSERFGLLPKRWLPYLDKLLLNEDNIIGELVHDGRIIYNYCLQRYASAVKKYGFEVLIDGKYRAICMLNTTFGSTQFKSVIHDYDCCIVVNRKGKDAYNISIYIEPEKSIDFNAGEYLKAHYSGGGHKNAGGGLLNFEQFQNLVYNQVV